MTAASGAPWPRVSRCRWCGTPVLRDNDDRWIHTNLSYVCRDPWGVIGSTTAEPEPPGSAPTGQHRRIPRPGHGADQPPPDPE